jgi:amino acid transporter
MQLTYPAGDGYVGAPAPMQTAEPSPIEPATAPAWPWGAVLLLFLLTFIALALQELRIARLEDKR